VNATGAFVTLDVAIPFVAFWLLLLAVVLTRRTRERMRAKTRDAWILDVTGLLVQGALIPLLEITLLFSLLNFAVPKWRGALSLPWEAAALLNFVVVDYLYYWNHRLLHTRALWPVHSVHHSVTDMDVLATSRNPVWASLLIVYVWVNGAFLFLLHDARPFAIAAAVTAALDLWRHSPFGPRRGSALWRVLSLVFITPSDHAWHHASGDAAHGNYGANLSVWDRLHGTWNRDAAEPRAVGIAVSLSLARQLFWPVAKASK
jgi:sterol desaturase/sphingolipid hydroxylase (fatty acid hydroxylase superfamily)